MLIENISDTARWVAYYRAMETARVDAHFRDPFARRLAGQRGEEIVRQLPGGAAGSWPMVVRTVLIDQLIRDATWQGGVDQVVSLAAGLDSRPYRMRLPPRLRWVEVDLPGILDHKEGILAGERPHCHLESVRLDLADEVSRRALFARLAGQAARTLVLTEGLLVYLTREQVAALARDLAAPPTFRSWVLDFLSPAILASLQRKWSGPLTAAAAPMQFGPAEGAAFFRPYGWQPVVHRYMFEEALRLRRHPWFFPLFGLAMRLTPPARRARLRDFSGVVQLERADPELSLRR